ncbi:MAG TPA: hypothetical protein EYP60_03600 [bacterium (Candidatus Stahlbacteria)]|nr:hypothetical protein [Candidatus Stahlbacteria bacterium]
MKKVIIDFKTGAGMQGVLKKLLVVVVIFIAAPAFCQIEPEAEPPLCPEGCEPEIDYLEGSDSLSYSEKGWTRWWDLKLISTGCTDTFEILIWDSSSVNEGWPGNPYVYTKLVKTTEENVTWYG